MSKHYNIINQIRNLFSSKTSNAPVLDETDTPVRESTPSQKPETVQLREDLSKVLSDSMRESMIRDGYESQTQDMLESGMSVKEKNEILGKRKDVASIPEVSIQEFSEKAAETHESILRKKDVFSDKARSVELQQIKEEMSAQTKVAKASRQASLAKVGSKKSAKKTSKPKSKKKKI
jgi:hypothetical protein